MSSYTPDKTPGIQDQSMIPQILVIVFVFANNPMMTVKTFEDPDRATCETHGTYLTLHANGENIGKAFYTCQDMGKDEMTPLHSPS